MGGGAVGVVILGKAKFNKFRIGCSAAWQSVSVVCRVHTFSSVLRSARPDLGWAVVLPAAVIRSTAGFGSGSSANEPLYTKNILPNYNEKHH
jgi:hypothetical protein